MSKRKKASMKVRVPGSNKSIAKAKYEIANEFGLDLENSKQLNEQGMNRSKTNSRVNSKVKSRRQKQEKNCK
ncbi:MAG: small, acid-soluble spore protein, alpha/beta type [Bacilli bacterium]|nr:small, acid-soluble spore protein, alpha/beta type [Bacilli bacterium]